MPIATAVTSEMPIEVKDWIAQFCAGKVTVGVGHRMGTYQEGIGNATLEETLSLIRNHAPVAKYIKEQPEGLSQVLGQVVLGVSHYVQAKFKNATYHGD